MRNQDWKKFLGIIKKIDNIDIVFQYKPSKVLNKKHFYNQKKCYSIDLYVVCNLQKRFIYILANFWNTTYNL